MFQLIEFGELLMLFIAMSVTALIAGATLAVLTFGRAASRKAKTAAIPIAIVGGFAVIMGGLIVDKQFNLSHPGNRRAGGAGGNPDAGGHGARPLCRVALRTPAGDGAGK